MPDPSAPYRIPPAHFFALARALPRLDDETPPETEARIAAELYTLDALAPVCALDATFALQLVLCAANTLAQFARANAPGQTPDGQRRCLAMAVTLQRGTERAAAMLLRLRRETAPPAPAARRPPAGAARPRLRADDGAPAPDPAALAAACRVPAPQAPAQPAPAGEAPPEPCWLWQKGQRRNIHEMSDEELRAVLDGWRDADGAGDAPPPGA
jgi:hypothetical protein